MKQERLSERAALILEVESEDAPEAVVAALAEARSAPELERIVLDLRQGQAFGLTLTPGTLLPPEVWLEVQDSFGVAPEDAPLDSRVRLVLEPEEITNVRYMGYDDYWALAETVEEALELD